MSEGIGYKIGVRAAPFLVYVILRCWYLTCRVRLHNEKYLKQVAEAERPFIATFWHYSIAYVFYNLRKQEAAVMVSASKDGEYIARLAGHYGFRAVRGSKNKRGLLALKEMMKLMKKGSNAGIVADGSQGPALKVQAGSIMLASRCKCPILPLVWSADKYIAFGSWDRMSIPKPFSQIDCYYGEPFHVPEKISTEEIEEYRVALEEKMNEMYKIAWAKHGKEEH